MIYGDKGTKIPDVNAIIQSNNLYAYCMNNPVNFVDTNGEVASGVIVALYGYAQAILTSPDLEYDMQMIAFDISEGDYLSASFDLIDLLIPAFSGSKAVPKFIGKYLDEVADSLKATGMRRLYRGSFKHNLTKLIGEAPKWMNNAEAHHVFPVKFETWFKSKGIKIHNPKFGSWVESTSHRKWSNEYNLEWERFIESHNGASIEDILDYGSQLAKKYGFEIHYLEE